MTFRKSSQASKGRESNKIEGAKSKNINIPPLILTLTFYTECNEGIIGSTRTHRRDKRATGLTPSHVPCIQISKPRRYFPRLASSILDWWFPLSWRALGSLYWWYLFSKCLRTSKKSAASWSFWTIYIQWFLWHHLPRWCSFHQ